jgi:hypothetical protein
MSRKLKRKSKSSDIERPQKPRKRKIKRFRKQKCAAYYSDGRKCKRNAVG